VSGLAEGGRERAGAKRKCAQRGANERGWKGFYYRTGREYKAASGEEN